MKLRTFGALTGVVASMVLCTTAASAPNPHVTMASPTWMLPLVRRLSVCESGGDPRHHVFNSEGEFEGIVSWAPSTWRADRPAGAPRDAWNATLREQYRAALTSLRRHRTFGCLRWSWVRGRLA